MSAAGENSAKTCRSRSKLMPAKRIMNSPRLLRHISFDLDGTIIDSFRTIYETTVKALQELKINSAVPENEFYNRIGFHFIDIFRDLNIPVKDFDEFIAVYKYHYFEFINYSKPFEGAEEVLKFLNGKEIKISLLTTKGQDQADRIIDYFNLRKYFSFVMGRRDNIANKPSAEPLLFICDNLSVIPQETLMVGDTELDIRCGKNAGAKTCAAAYGYRPEETLRKEKPDYFLKSIKELKYFTFN